VDTTPFETTYGPPSDAADSTASAPAVTPSISAALDLADAVTNYSRPARGSDRWRTVLDAFAVLAIALGAVGIFALGMYAHSRVAGGGSNNAAAAAPPAQANSGAQAGAPAKVQVSPDDDPSQGPQDALVTMIEFADFQCPYCGRFHAQTLPLILKEYGDRIRLVYRDFPLTSIHQYAEKAAEAGECAHEQDKFWEYHDVMYLNQTALDRESLGRYAQNAGLDMAKFNSCLDSGKYATEVAADLQAGAAAGVRGTPAFFVNGQLISGAQPYSVFKAAIDAALADAR
jgi:protein-disulfide isomerase